MSINWTELKSLIDRSQNIILTSHIRPDCDALGSELGMAELLRKLGKRVRVVNGQATPPNLAFIDPEQEIMTIDVDVTAEELMDADLWMILDTSAVAQLGPMADIIARFSGTRIIFDHHLGEDDLGAIAFKDTSAEATGRLVAEAAGQFGVALTPEMATPLFAAIATDTGWFRFSSVSSLTYQMAGKLVDAGASPPEIYGHLYEQETLGRLRLRGVVLNRIRTECEGRLAHTFILRADYAETGAHPTDTEDLVNHCLEIKGTRFAVILVEQPDGGFKISFRSRCAVACNEIAREFGGGGHKAAAGAFVDAPFSEAQSIILDHVRPYFA
jgi:phosphoesterase RecJ-like protein